MTMDKDGSRTPPPLAPSLGVLLAHERVIAPQSHAVRQRALARAHAVLHEERTPWFHRFVPSRRLLVSAAAAVGLIAAAAAAYQHLRRPAPQVVPTVTPVPSHQASAFPSVLEVTSAPAAAPPATVASPSAVPPQAAKAARRSQGAPLAQARPEELRLLVLARQASNRGDYPSVLAAVSEHQSRFPSGQLAEEREALRIKALVGLGRLGEARSAAAEFRRRFPRSVLLSKIDNLLSARAGEPR
jgi:hypothetical protein